MNDRVKNAAKPKRVLFMGFRRGGSSIIFEGLQRLFAESGLSSSDIVAARHMNPEEKTLDVSELASAFQQFTLVGCMREPMVGEADLSEYETHTILVVRDPRDCDISWYHAQDLHDIERRSFGTLDAYLKNVDDSEYYLSLVEYGRKLGARIFRYEDIFFNPAKALADMFKGMDLPLKQSAFDMATIVLALSRTIPDVKSHNRSGLPFQATSTLSQRSLSLLNKRHAKLLAEFDYPLKPTTSRDLEIESRFEVDAIKRFALTLARANSLRVLDLQHRDAIINGMINRIEALEAEVARMKS